MKMLRLVCSAAPLLAVTSSGCNRRGAGALPPSEPKVLAALPVVKTVTDYVEFTGKTESQKSVQLRAQVTGYLDKVLFVGREGHEVQEGEGLFKIDPRVYEAELSRQKAAVAQAKAHLERTEFDYRRAEELLKKHAISQADYDQAKGDRDEAAAALQAAEAARQTAQNNVDFTLVSAAGDRRDRPLAGRSGEPGHGQHHALDHAGLAGPDVRLLRR